MTKCEVPPPGWKCSRDKGHEGPCAASPETERISTAEALEFIEQYQLRADGYPVASLATDLVEARRETVRVRNDWQKKYWDASWFAETLYQALLSDRPQFQKDTRKRYEDYKKGKQAS